MSRSVLIDTPENVELEYELAGIANRFAASFVDTLVQIGSIVALLLLFAIVSMLVAATHFAPLIVAVRYLSTLSGVVLGGGAFLFWIAYYAVFETVWSGANAWQTPDGAEGD